MPEGHTIHRLERDLRRDLAGQRVRAESRQDRFEAGAARVDGQVVTTTEAYGKHLFVHLDSGAVLHVHLGLVGTFRRRRPSEAPSPAVRLRMATDDWAWDLTGAMTCRLADESHRAAVVEPLGPDPLRRDADPMAFVGAVTTSRRAVAVQLLDQRVIAGIGNVYRAEILFLTAVHPARRGVDLDEVAVKELWTLTQRLLREGVRRNRIVTRDDEDLPAGRFDRSEAVYVYQRAGEACRRCATPIARTELGGRKVWWCPVCQPE